MKALEADTSNNTNTVQNRLDMLLAQKAKEMGLDFVHTRWSHVYFCTNQSRRILMEYNLPISTLEKGLAVAPGEGFGDYKNFIRISACQDEKTLMEGMNILGNIMR